MQLVHTRTLGGKGTGPAAIQLRLMGVAVHRRDGRLFVLADREVKRFSAAGDFELRFPVTESARAITVTQDSIWIGAFGGVVRYDLDGLPQERIDDGARLGRVTGLAAAGDHLFVADATHRAIYLYRQGTWLQEVGSDVNTRGFMLPNGVLDIAVDEGSQTLWVAHPQKHRVEQYDRTGKHLKSFGRFGMEHPGDFGGCCNPTNICAEEELVIVTEKAPPSIKVYSKDGEYLCQSAADVFDESAKNIYVTMDQEEKVYATDRIKLTVEVFQLT